MDHEQTEVIALKTQPKPKRLSHYALIAFGLLLLTGCNTYRHQGPNITGVLAGGGGGFAILNNGQLVGIERDGTLGNSCNICRVEESRSACQERAERLSIPLCDDLAKDATKYGDFRSTEPHSRDAQSKQLVLARVAMIGSLFGLAQNGNLCPTFSHDGMLRLESVMLHTPGYTCTKYDAVNTCICRKET